MSRSVVPSPEAPDERALVRRAAAGDRDAFAAIYRAHVDRVFALLTRLIGPYHEREDLLQEVFLRLHVALARFRGEAGLHTFVYQITTRVAIDHLRRRRRGVVPGTLELDDTPDPAATPAERAVQRGELARALALLAKLSPAQRVTFVLREIMNMSHDEVARLTGVHPAAARMRVALARRKLARLAGKEGAR